MLTELNAIDRLMASFDWESPLIRHVHRRRHRKIHTIGCDFSTSMSVQRSHQAAAVRLLLLWPGGTIPGAAAYLMRVQMEEI